MIHSILWISMRDMCISSVKEMVAIMVIVQKLSLEI